MELIDASSSYYVAVELEETTNSLSIDFILVKQATKSLNRTRPSLSLYRIIMAFLVLLDRVIPERQSELHRNVNHEFILDR